MASMHLLPSLQTRKQVASIATVALAGITYFALAIVALHLLRPDLHPIQRPTSEYAVGPYGWLMTSAFFSMSVATWALIIGLYHRIAQPARLRIGLGLLAVWGVGLLIAMRFPIDLDGVPQTLSGTIHAINGPLTFLSLTAGVIVVTRRFKHDEQWRPIHRSALILSLVMLALCIATPLSVAAEAGVAGLCQRSFLIAFVKWFVLAAMRLRSLARGSVSA